MVGCSGASGTKARQLVHLQLQLQETELLCANGGCPAATRAITTKAEQILHLCQDVRPNIPRCVQGPSCKLQSSPLATFLLGISSSWTEDHDSSHTATQQLNKRLTLSLHIVEPHCVHPCTTVPVEQQLSSSSSCSVRLACLQNQLLNHPLSVHMVQGYAAPMSGPPAAPKTRLSLP